ncbi:MAG: PASTA domain-containing protein [Eggerthellaceae bacterium]|nr:PASTA domain-containing protein [Eggerthellaceae bacterium]
MLKRSTVAKVITCAIAAALFVVAIALVSCAPAESGKTHSHESMSASDISEAASKVASSSSASSSSSAASSSSSAAPQMISVPNVVSLTTTQAKYAITGSGLMVSRIDSKHSSDVPTGHVISQDPAPGTAVNKGTGVSFVVSLGKEHPSKASVPDVTGMSWSEAKSTLKSANLNAAKKGDTSGEVVSQDIAAGTLVDKGTTVTVTLSSPKPAQVKVPNVIGKTWNDAKAALESAGLGAAKKGDSEGAVESQSIAAGTKVDKGTTVTVTLASPKPTQVTVPDVTGKNWADAKATLESAQLTAAETGDPDGTVTSQDVAAGTQVDPGTTVTVTLSAPKPTQVTVPDVTGKNWADAKAALESAQLTAAETGDPDGTVTSQDVAAGTQVDPGTTVTVTLSAPKPEQVAVPDVRGETQQDAESNLGKAELKGVCSGEVQSSTVDPGCVVRQSIDPGTMVDKGTEVSFYIAAPPSKIAVPYIEDKKSEEAKSLVEEAGLVYASTEDYSDDVEKGCVISQDPKSETEVAPGTTVNAVVSLGPEPKKQVEVPDLTDMTWPDAKSALENAELKAAKNGDSDGNVESQDIAAGEEVDKGTTVTVTLSSPKPQTKVPKVEGLLWDDAKEAIENADLNVDRTGDKDGVVVSQNPNSGQSVDEGSSVTVKVDKNGKVKVPNVVGQSVESARQALEDAGLKPDPDIPNHGTISAQNPANGQAKFGSVVKLTVDDSDFK